MLNFQAIELSCQLASKSELKLSDLFRKAYIKPVSISLGLMFFQQFSGINAVMFYSVRYFDPPLLLFYLFQWKLIMF